MRPVLFWILIAWAAQPVQGQPFNHRYDLLDMHRAQGAWDIEQEGDSTYMVLGVSADEDSLGPDSFFYYYSVSFQRVSQQGALLFENRFNYALHGVTVGWANCCDTMPGGGFVIGGGISDTADGLSVLLMRFDASGDTLWTKVFGPPGERWIGRQVKRTVDGGFIIVGERKAGGQTDAFALRTDAGGAERWVQTYGGNWFDGFVSVIETADGFIFGGEYSASATNKQNWLVRVDTLGAQIWSMPWGGPFDDPNAQCAALANGNVAVVSCRGHANDFTATRSYIAEIDPSDGGVIWEHQFGAIASGTLLFAVHEVASGGVVACGIQDAGNTSGTVLRTTADGDSSWMRAFRYTDTLVSQSQGYFYDILPTDDGGFIAAGVAYETFGGAYDQDVWVVRMDSMGCIVPGCDGVSGISEYITNLGDALTVYPVPLRREQGDMGLHVRIALPTHFRTEGPLMLTMTSLDGRLVRQQQVPTSATDEVTVEVSALASGTYALHLSDAQRWIAGKTFVVE